MRCTRAALQRLLFAAALWAAVVVSGQELSRTQISDTLFNADGSRSEGSLSVSWRSFTAKDESTVPQNSIDVAIVDGVVALSLAPNEGAVPEGTSYMVRYRLRGSRPFTELWVVPDASEPVKISDIRVQVAPPSGTSVSMSQVSGLPSALSEKADRSGPNTFIGSQVLREDAPGSTNSLLGFQKNDGAAGVYFRLPPLSGDVTYTLPPSDGAPNQALTTDGSGSLFWTSAAGGGAGSGSAYEVLQQAGSSVTQRTVANFTGGFVLSDNGGQLRTDIAPNFGTSAGTIAEGNDVRFSDARTPLAHASTHATAGGDAITPVSIGALGRTNDFMVGANSTVAVLKIQGASGQTAALQEWRDGAGSLAALVTAQGAGFFREMGIAAPVGSTTVSEFFEIGGLKKFALSATDGVFDVLRYDDVGSFVDRPLRVFRSGNIETSVSLDIADATVGSGTLGLTGDYIELDAVTPPTTPAAGFGRLYLDSSSGEVSVKKATGATLSLEQGGSGMGDVVGPASATDNGIARFDSTTGKLLQDSSCTISDTGVLACGSGPLNITGLSDDVAPTAPATANECTSYWNRSSTFWSWICNGGSAQTAVATAGTQTLQDKTLTAPTINNPVQSTNTYQTFTEMTPPGNPSANDARVYAKDDGGTTKFCIKDSAGVETCVGDGGGSSCSGYHYEKMAVDNIGSSAQNLVDDGGDASTVDDTVTGGSVNFGYVGLPVGNSVSFHMLVPPCYTAETFTFRLLARDISSTTGDATMNIQTGFAGDDDTFPPTLNTAQTITIVEAGYTSGDIIIDSIATLTVTGIVAGESMVVSIEHDSGSSYGQSVQVIAAAVSWE